MKCWVVSDAGDKWSVRLDVRDLGGHLDCTFRARAVTFGSRMAAAIHRVRAVAVLPLEFVGGLLVLGSSELPFVRLLCLVAFAWLILVLF